MSTETDTTAASIKHFTYSIRIDPGVLNVMGKRSWSPSLQVKWDHFLKNVQNMASWDWYKDAHTQTMLMSQESKKAKSSCVVIPKPLTIRHIVRTANPIPLTHPIYYEVNNVTVSKYVCLGKANESPEKIGRPPRVPDALMEASNLYVTRIQALVTSAKQISQLVWLVLTTWFKDLNLRVCPP